jgi:hypothetical protein
MVELAKLELMRMILPPMEREPPCHTSSFLANFSSNLAQSITLNLIADIGTPKYFKGNNPIWQLNILAY